MLTQRSHHPLPQQGAANGHWVDYQQPQHQFCPHRRQVQTDHLVIEDDNDQTVVQVDEVAGPMISLSAFG